MKGTTMIQYNFWLLLSAIGGIAYAVDAPTNVRIDTTGETNDSTIIRWDYGSSKVEFNIYRKINRTEYILLETNSSADARSAAIGGLTPAAGYTLAVSAYSGGTESAKVHASGTTTHTWSGALQGCADDALSLPPDHILTRAELESIIEFTCYSAGLTDMTPVQDLSNLTVLGLSNNALTGPIPDWVGTFAPLSELYLYDNNFTGPIPDSLGSLPLEFLFLHENNLSGPLPASFADLNDTLIDIRVFKNHLNGPIPSWFNRFGMLQTLNLNFNDFNGTIPSELGDLPKLHFLYLSGNRLSGTIPASLGNLHSLIELNLGENNLSGPIPASLGDLNSSSFNWLTLDHNRLSGAIPSELGDLVSMEYLELDHNQLTGTIPKRLGNLTALKMLSLSYNHLYGTIPHELTALTNLIPYNLNLTYNCDLHADDNNTIDWLETYYPGMTYYNFLKTNDGNCTQGGNNIPVLMYLLD